jgi:hypothetical protein
MECSNCLCSDRRLLSVNSEAAIMTMTTLAFAVDPKMIDEIRALAAAEGNRSMSSVIRAAVDESLCGRGGILLR